MQCSPSVVNSAVYSIKWAHEINGFIDPTNNTFVKSLLESAKRLNGKPVNKKDPVNKEMLVELFDMYKNNDDLLVIRDLTMIILSFSGFLRFDEISNLKCKDIQIFDDYIKIFIANSKTDQYRQGNDILISRGNTSACPVNMYKRYVNMSGLDITSNEFLFKPIFRTKGVAKLIYKNKPLSYTAARENILKRLKLVAPFRRRHCRC